MSVDKKNIDGAIRVIGLEKIGRASLPFNVKREVLEQTLNNTIGT
jgi:3-dehydroquinate synthetase